MAVTGTDRPACSDSAPYRGAVEHPHRPLRRNRVSGIRSRCRVSRSMPAIYWKHTRHPSRGSILPMQGHPSSPGATGAEAARGHGATVTACAPSDGSCPWTLGTCPDRAAMPACDSGGPARRVPGPTGCHQGGRVDPYCRRTDRDRAAPASAAASRAAWRVPRVARIPQRLQARAGRPCVTRVSLSKMARPAGPGLCGARAVSTPP